VSAELTPALVRRLADMHAVYRMYDHSGRLLYIGMSGRAGRRFDEHAKKRWFPLVSTITLEWHDTHAAAVLAEKRAIADEQPRYNIAGSPFAMKKRAASRRSSAASEDSAVAPTVTSLLADVLAVFAEQERHLHWDVIAERLDAEFPGRWREATAKLVSARCRAFGIPAVSCRMGIHVKNGCKKADVADAILRQAA